MIIQPQSNRKKHNLTINQPLVKIRHITLSWYQHKMSL